MFAEFICRRMWRSNVPKLIYSFGVTEQDFAFLLQQDAAGTMALLWEKLALTAREQRKARSNNLQG